MSSQLDLAAPENVGLLGAVLAATVNIVATARAHSRAQVDRCTDVAQLLYLALAVFTTLRALLFISDLRIAWIMWAACAASTALQAWYHVRRPNDVHYRVASVIKVNFIQLMQLPMMLMWHGNPIHRQKYGESLCSTAFYCINAWNILTFPITNDIPMQLQRQADAKQDGEAQTPTSTFKRLSYIPCINIILVAGIQLL